MRPGDLGNGSDVVDHTRGRFGVDQADEVRRAGALQGLLDLLGPHGAVEGHD